MGKTSVGDLTVDIKLSLESIKFLAEMTQRLKEIYGPRHITPEDFAFIMSKLSEIESRFAAMSILI